MGNFFSSLFSFSQEEREGESREKNDRKKFDILKYDGVRAQKIGKLAYAIKCFTEAIAIQEDFETMSYLVGAYTMAHEPEKALEVLDRMQDIDSSHINIMYTRVNVFFLLNREEDVIKECLHILELEPSSHIAYLLLGRAKKNMGNLDDAFDDLTTSISLNEEIPDVYLLRSEVLYMKGNATDALADAEKALSLEGDDEAANLLKGQILELSGNPAGAEECYRDVLDLNPFNEKAGLLLADLLITSDQFEEAGALLDEIIELNPSSVKAYEERGRLKNLMGNAAGSEEDLLRAGELKNAEMEILADAGKPADFESMNKGVIF